MSVSTSTPKAILEALQKALASGPAGKRGDAFYKPRSQPFWYYDGSKWTSTESTSFSPSASPKMNTKSLRLISWNIDMLIGHAKPRMSAALAHLCSLVSSTPTQTPIIVFLQEMTTTDLEQISHTDWIQQKFAVTDIDTKNWQSHLYGTATLVDRRLYVKSVFRVPWISKFERDGLFVDISLSRSENNAQEEKILRLCNTHLESLVADPPVRPLQLAAAAPYLHDKNVAAALLAGDLNAIQPFDRTLHVENDLEDAYLKLGGREDDDEGFTWGYQVPQAFREKFGCSRMDKILFRGELDIEAFERIGKGVEVQEEELKETMKREGEGAWVTDHYGVMGNFSLTGGWDLKTSEMDGNDVRRSSCRLDSVEQ